MQRLLQPFVLAVTALLAGGYVYVAARLGSGLWERAALGIPFVLVWIVPVIYWSRQRDAEETWLDEAAHQASYLAMAWVSFILVCTLARDLALFVTSALSLRAAHEAVARDGVPMV